MAKKSSPVKKASSKKPAPRADTKQPPQTANTRAMAPPAGPPQGTVTTTLPASQAQVLCNPNPPGSICSQGTATPPSGNSLTAVSALIYPSATPIANIPATPVGVAGTTAGVVFATTHWRFTGADGNLIPNAQAAAAAPFPANILVVWASWDTTPVRYNRGIVVFDGIQATVTDCDGGGGSKGGSIMTK